MNDVIDIVLVQRDKVTPYSEQKLERINAG